MNTKTTCIAAIAGALLAPVAGAETLTLSSSTPTPIPDLGEATIVLPASAPGGRVVAGVSMDLDLTHPWIGDLVITLEHQGVTVRLADRIGLANYPFACGGDDIAATFEDGAATTPEDLCGPGPGPTVTGLVRPLDAFAAFNGVAGAGAWTVRVADAGAYDAGTLTAVTVRIELAAPAECAGDVNGDDRTNVLDFNILAGHYGQSVSPNTGGDLTGDGLVNVSDFNLLAGNYGCDAWAAARLE